MSGCAHVHTCAARREWKRAGCHGEDTTAAKHARAHARERRRRRRRRDGREGRRGWGHLFKRMRISQNRRRREEGGGSKLGACRAALRPRAGGVSHSNVGIRCDLEPAERHVQHDAFRDKQVGVTRWEEPAPRRRGCRGVRGGAWGAGGGQCGTGRGARAWVHVGARGPEEMERNAQPTHAPAGLPSAPRQP